MRALVSGVSMLQQERPCMTIQIVEQLGHGSITTIENDGRELAGAGTIMTGTRILSFYSMGTEIPSHNSRPPYRSYLTTQNDDTIHTFMRMKMMANIYGTIAEEFYCTNQELTFQMEKLTNYLT